MNLYFNKHPFDLVIKLYLYLHNDSFIKILYLQLYILKSYFIFLQEIIKLIN